MEMPISRVVDTRMFQALPRERIGRTVAPWLHLPPIFGWVTYLVAAGSGGNLSPLRSVKLVRLLRIMKLMKMLRLAKFLRFRTARKSNFTAKNEFVKN